MLGPSGLGETLFLREIWPDTKLLVYVELMYRTRGHDVRFDAETNPASDESRVSTVARLAHLLQADAGIVPTRYQLDSFSPERRGKLTMIHDGIDTDKVRPQPRRDLEPAERARAARGDEVVSYVSRSLEPYRGLHVFMRALPHVLAERPEAQVALVGGDG